MADKEAEFDAFVIERLNKLGLDDETFVEYVYGIVKLEEAVSTREDKAEGLEEFLSEATEEQVDETITSILDHWDQVMTCKSKEQADETAEQLKVAAEEQDRLLKESAVRAEEAAQEQARVTAAEEEKKQALLDTYLGMDESELNGDAEQPDEEAVAKKPLSYKKEKKIRKQMNAFDIAANFENTNRSFASSKEAQKREQQRASSQARKQRDQAAQKGDRDKKAAAKEARKQKAAKRERRG